jgi:hypothetical protein
MPKTEPLTDRERGTLIAGSPGSMAHVFGSLDAALRAYEGHAGDLRTVRGTKPAAFWLFRADVPDDLRSQEHFARHGDTAAIAERARRLAASDGLTVSTDRHRAVATQAILSERRRAWLVEHPTA